MKCEMRQQVLAYLRGESGVKIKEVEEHLETCAECVALVEGYMEKEQELQLELEGWQGKDEKLKERVVHYEKGTRRIVIFTLVGLLMGWLSIRYYTDSFLVTKVILAVPYKLGEMLHNVLHQSHYDYYPGELNEFFPGDGLSTFLAERIVPVLFGGAVYGSLAYFTGDKRIFTLKRYLKFAAVWAAVILGFTEMTFAVNSWREQRADSLQNVDYFFLSSPVSGSGFGEGLGNEVRNGTFYKLKEAFYADGMPKRCDSLQREHEKEIPEALGMGTYQMEVWVNYEDCYLITKRGTAYRISEEFAAYVKEYYETDSVAGKRYVIVESGEAE